jgi:hypothetical protein
VECGGLRISELQDGAPGFSDLPTTLKIKATFLQRSLLLEQHENMDRYGSKINVDIKVFAKILVIDIPDPR